MPARSLLSLFLIALFAFWKKVQSDNPRRDLIYALIFIGMIVVPCLLAVLTDLSDPEELN